MMSRRRIASGAACAALCLGIATAGAQKAAPPPPSFAPADLTPAGVRAMAGNCAACHGTDGNAAPDTADFGLAGMRASVFVAKMKQFHEGKRPASVMHQVVKGYSDAEIEALAKHFAALRPQRRD